MTAVAGRVEVYNRARGVIPRMVHVRYMLLVDMLRATVCIDRDVYCCPGALTGLRASVVHTLVPIRYVKLCKLLLRWDRSYVREGLRFTRIVWKRPWPTRVIALFARAVTTFRYPASYSSLGLLPLW